MGLYFLFEKENKEKNTQTNTHRHTHTDTHTQTHTQTHTHRHTYTDTHTHTHTQKKERKIKKKIGDRDTANYVCMYGGYSLLTFGDHGLAYLVMFCMKCLDLLTKQNSVKHSGMEGCLV